MAKEHKSQIDMTIPPTAPEHVIRGEEVGLTTSPDFTLLIKYGNLFIPVDLDVVPRIGSSNPITSDAVAAVLNNSATKDSVTALSTALAALAANLTQNYLRNTQLLPLAIGGLNADASGYADYSLLVKMNGQYTPVDIDVTPQTGSSNLITSDAAAGLSGRIDEINARLTAAGIK